MNLLLLSMFIMYMYTVPVVDANNKYGHSFEHWGQRKFEQKKLSLFVSDIFSPFQ